MNNAAPASAEPGDQRPVVGYQGQHNAERAADAKTESQHQKQFAGGQTAPDHPLAVEAVGEKGDGRHITGRPKPG